VGSLCAILICVTSLPLLVYPILLVANVMSLAAPPPATPAPLSLSIAASGFLWGSTLYPLAYLIAIAATVMSLARDRIRMALGWQIGLLGYLVLVGFLLGAWMTLERP